MNQNKANKTMTSAEEEKELTLIDHLVELRDRVLRSIVAVLVIFFALFYFRDNIYIFVVNPLLEALPEGTSMIAIDPTSPFFAPFKLTFYVSFLIAAPYVLYQLWSFIAPGLYKNEKSVAIPLFVSSVLLFYSGVAFARFALFNLVFAFFISVTPEGIAVAPDINSVLSFVLSICLAFGIAFEVPIAVFILIWTGITEPDALAEKRPYVIVGCFVVGMLLTPSDPISQTMLAIPMWILFEVGIVAGRLFRKKQAAQEAEEAKESENE